MSQLNPYDSFLDGRPVDAILSSTADAIADCIYAIGPKKVRQSARARQMERSRDRLPPRRL